VIGDPAQPAGARVPAGVPVRRRVISRGISLGVAVLVLVAALLATGAQAASVPVPENDPFYAVPAGIASLANGTVLNSREVQVSTLGLPLPATAWQVQYKTLNSTMQPTADVTTILVPRARWTGSGPRPLVSYQTAEDGVAGKCSASYALRTGVLALDGNSEEETTLIAAALGRGFAVAAPDYEGPNSAFLGAPGEAHSVLDGIRAALHFAPDGFTVHTPVALWGYSGGSIASADAAELQPAYAPELKLAGVAVGGMVASIQATINDFNSDELGGVIPMIIAGLERAYPADDLGQYLNATGNADVAAAGGDCLLAAEFQFPGLRISQIEASPGAWQSPAFQAVMTANSPAAIPGTPTAPIYDYHAVLDELAPIADDRSLMHRFCDSGVPVQHVEALGPEHITETFAGAPGALNFLGDRFAGDPPVNTCASIPPAPVDPVPAATTGVATTTTPACRRERTVTLRIRALHDVRVTVNGRRILVHHHRNVSQTTINLSRLPKGTVTVRVTGLSTHDKRVTQTHRYRSCTADRDLASAKVPIHGGLVPTG
jgi:Secretory lipase